MTTEVQNKLEAFFSKYSVRKFQKGHVLVQEGDEPPGIFFVQEGIIRRFWISEDGDEITLNLYKPNSFLPMSWAIADVPNTHIYSALTDISIRQAPKDEVIAFVKNEPDVLYDLLKRVYIGMEGLWTHIEHMTTGDSYAKLVTSLVILAKRFGKKDQEKIVIDLDLSEKDIASYTGLARETANRILQKLKKEGLVTFEKTMITIHDLQKLEKQL